MARPKALTKKRRRAFLEAYAASGNMTTACEQAGIGRTTVWALRKSDPVFAAEVEAAEDDLGDRLLTTVMRYGVEGVPYVKEKFDGTGKLIERETGLKISPNLAWNLAERFARPLREAPPKRLELSGPGGGPVPVSNRTEAADLAARLSYEQLCKLRDLERQRDDLLGTAPAA